MKRTIAITLAVLVTISGLLAACSGTENESESTTAAGLENADNVYSLDESITVTDTDGNAVTDDNGDVVTTKVQVKYDKNGIGYVIDSDGKNVTDSKGENVTITTTEYSEDEHIPTTKKHTTQAETTATTNGKEETTAKEHTTIEASKDKVPSTSESGTAVALSAEDQQKIKSMLEVPYLYSANYENADGIPTSIAKHAALWMAEREQLNTSTYASQSIVLDLFVYFGQTVVNFKTNCNNDKSCENIVYNAGMDAFKISDFENPTHSINIKKAEYLGNNNYYKITADVKGVKGKKKVVAIMQKNKLDSSLGFSVKALKWS